MKKRPQKQETHTFSDLGRYIGVLHEEHMGALKAMGEQFVDVNRRFDGIDKKLDSHTEMIGKLTVDLEVVKSDVEIIKSDIGIIKTDLKQKVDRTEFAILERRVMRLESKVR